MDIFQRGFYFYIKLFYMFVCCQKLLSGVLSSKDIFLLFSDLFQPELADPDQIPHYWRGHSGTGADSG